MPKTELSRLGGDRASGHLAGQEGQRHFWAMVAPAFSTPAVAAPGHERQLLRNAAVAPAAMARELLVSSPADAYSEFVGVNQLSQTDSLLDFQPAASSKSAAFQMFSADPDAAALVEDTLRAEAEPRGPRGHAGPALGFSPSPHSPRTSTGFPSGPKDSSCLSSEGRRTQTVSLDGASGQMFSPENGHQGTSSQVVCAVSNLSADASALAAQSAGQTWEKEQPDLFSSGDSIKTLLHQTREILSSFARSGQPAPVSPERQEGSAPNPRGHVVSRGLHGIQGDNRSSEADEGDVSLAKQTTCHLGAVTPSGFPASDSNRRSPQGRTFLTPEGLTSRTPQRFPSVCTPQRTLSLTTPQAIIAMAEPLGEEDTEDGLWLPESLGPSAWSTGGACSLPTSAPDARRVDRGGFHRRMEGDEELKRRYAEHMQRIASIPTPGPGSRNLSPAASYIAAAAEAIAADFRDDEGVNASPRGAAEECSMHEQTNGKDADTSGDLRWVSRESASSSKPRGLSGLPPVADTSTSGTNACWEASVHASCQLPRETEGLRETGVSSGKETWGSLPIGDRCAAPAREEKKASDSGKSSPVDIHARTASKTTSHRAPTEGRLSEVYLASLLQPTEVLLDRTAALCAAVANPEVYVQLAKAFHNQSARRDWTSDPEFAYSCTDSSCNGSVPCEIASPSLDLLPVFFASSRHAPEGLARLSPGVAAAAALPAAEADSILHFCYRISLEPKRPAFQQIRLPSRANASHSQGLCLKCCLSVSLFPSRGDQSPNDEQRQKESAGVSSKCKCRHRSSFGGDRRDEAGVAVDSTGAVEEHIASCLPFRSSFSASTKHSAVSSLGNISAALSRAPPLVFDGPPAFWGFEASPSFSDRSRESSTALQNACSDSETAWVSPFSVIPPRFNGTLGEDDVSVEPSSFAVPGKTSAAAVLEAPGAAKRRRVTACADVASSAARTSTSVQSMLAQVYDQSFFYSGTFKIPATVFGFRLARCIAAAARDARITVSGTPNTRASLSACTDSNGSEDHLRTTCALLVLPEERSTDLPGIQADSGLSGKPGTSTSSSVTSPTFVAPASPWERLMCCRDPPSRVSFVSSKAKLRLLPASGSVSRGASAAASTSVWGQKGDSGAGTCRPDEGVWVVRQAGTGVPLAVRAAVACTDSTLFREGTPDSDTSGLLREEPEGGGTRRRRMSTSSAPGTPNRKLHSGRRPVSPAWRGSRGASRTATADAAVTHQRFAGEKRGHRDGTAWGVGGDDNGGTGEASRPRMMERFFLLDAHETAAAEPMPARLRRVRQMACSWFRNKKLQQCLYHWRRHLPVGADAPQSEREANAPALPLFLRASAFDGASGECSEKGELGGTGTGARTGLRAPSVWTDQHASEGLELPLAILQEAEAERGRVGHLHVLAHALISKLATLAEPLPLQATCCGCLLLSTLRSSSLAVPSRGLGSEDQEATANGDECLVQGEEAKEEEDTLLSPHEDKEAAGVSSRTCPACSLRLGLRWREDAFAFEYFVAICRRSLTAEGAGREEVSEEPAAGVYQSDGREAENRGCQGGGRPGESQEEVDATFGLQGESSAEKREGRQPEGMRKKKEVLGSTEGDRGEVGFKSDDADVFSRTEDCESAKDETACVLVLVHDVIQPCVFDFVSVQVAFRAVLSRLLPFLAFREECWEAFADTPEFRQLLASIAEQRGLCPEKPRVSEGAQRASASSGSLGRSETWKRGENTRARSVETKLQRDPDRDDGGEAKREPDEMSRETSESPASESLSFHDLCRLLRRVSGTPCSLLESLESFVQGSNGTHAPRAKPQACSKGSARVLPSVCPPFTVAKRRRRPIGRERVLRQLLFSSQPSANPQTRGSNCRLLRRGGGAASALDRLGASGVGRPLAIDTPVDASGFQKSIQRLLEAEAFSVNCGYFSVPWSSSPPSSLKEDLFFAVFFPTQQALCCRRRMRASPGGLATEEQEEGLFWSGEETEDTLSAEGHEDRARRAANACMRGLLQSLWPGKWPWREEAGEGLPLSVEEAWEVETGSQLLEEIERDSRKSRGTGALSFKCGLATASDGFEKRYATLVKKRESLRSPLVSQAEAGSREKTMTVAGTSMNSGERGAERVVGGQAATFEVFDANKLRGEFCPFLSEDSDTSKDANQPSRNALFFDGPGAAQNVGSPPEDLRWLLLPTASASLRTTPAAALHGCSGAPSSSVPGDPSVSKHLVNDTDSSSASVASAYSPTLIPAPALETSPPGLPALVSMAEMATSGRAAEADRAAGSLPSTPTTPPQAAGLSVLIAKADDQSPTVSRHSEPRTAAGTGCDSTATASSTRQPGSSAEDESSGAESVSAAAGPSWGTLEHDLPFQAKAGVVDDDQLKVRAGDGSRESGRPGGDAGSEVAKRRLWATDAEVTELREGLDFRLDWASDCDYGNGGSSESDAEAPEGGVEQVHAGFVAGHTVSRRSKKPLLTFEEPVSEAEIFGVVQGAPGVRSEEEKPGETLRGPPRGGEGGRTPRSGLASVLREICSLRSPPALLALLRLSAPPPLGASRALGDGAVSPGSYVSGGHALRPRRGSDVSVAAAEQVTGKALHGGGAPGENRRGLSVSTEDYRQGDAVRASREETLRGGGRETEVSVQKRPRTGPVPQDPRPGASRGGLSLPAAFLSSSAVPANPSGYSPSSRGSTPAAELSSACVHSPGFSGTPWSKPQTYGSLVSSPRWRLAHFLGSASVGPGASGSPAYAGSLADGREVAPGACVSPPIPGGAEAARAGMGRTGAEGAGTAAGSIAAVMSALAQHVKQRPRQARGSAATSGEVPRGGEGRPMDLAAILRTQQAASGGGVGGPRSPVGAAMESASAALLGALAEQALQATPPRSQARATPLTTAEVLEAAARRASDGPGDREEARGAREEARGAREEARGARGGPTVGSAAIGEDADAWGALGALGSRGNPRELLTGCSPETRQHLSLLLAAAEMERGQGSLDGRERGQSSMSPGEQQRLLAATAALRIAALEAASRRRPDTEPRQASCGANTPLETQLQNLKRVLGIGISEGAGPKKAAPTGLPARSATNLVPALAGEVAASPVTLAAAPPGPVSPTSAPEAPDAAGVSDVSDRVAPGPRDPRSRPASPADPASLLHATLQPEGAEREGRRTRGVGGPGRRDRTDSSSYSEDSHCEDSGGLAAGSGSGAPSSGGGTPRAGGLEEDELVPIGALPTGVYFDVARRLWRCQWREDGRLKSSGFSLKHYKTLEAARAACILYKCAMTNTRIDPAWMVPEYIPLSMASKRLVKQRHQAAGLHAGAGEKPRASEEDPCVHSGVSRRRRPADGAGGASPTSRGPLSLDDEDLADRRLAPQPMGALQTPQSLLSALGLQGRVSPGPEGDISPCASPAAGLFAGTGSLGLEAMLAAAEGHVRVAGLKAGALPQSSQDPRALLKLLEEASQQN